MTLHAAHVRAMDVQTFEALRVLTLGLLAERGLAPPILGEGFVEFWLSRGKTPEEIVRIAFGEPRANPDNHLGGIES